MNNNKKNTTSTSNLENLDITTHELNLFKEAFQKDEFKKLFADYCQEINDPDNIKQYQSEYIQFEAERGYCIKFINPIPGYVIKTSVNGEQKAFINVAHNENVGKPISNPKINEKGENGLNWSIPYLQSQPRHDYDKKRKLCSVYDVVFHPDTLHLAERNMGFRELVTQTACQAVEITFNVTIDVANLKFPNIKYKGKAQATITRTKLPNSQNDLENGVHNNNGTDPSILDAICPVPISEANENIAINMFDSSKMKTKFDEYTKPKYHIKYRRNVDYHELTNELDSKINLTVPKELLIVIDLPLLNSTENCQLDVTTKNIYLLSVVQAKYKLYIDLPYNVNEINGSAQFDKNTRQLNILLPVIHKNQITIGHICREDSGVESDRCNSPRNENEEYSKRKPELNKKELIEKINSFDNEENDENANTTESASITNNNITSEEIQSTFFDNSLCYNLPSFTHNILENTIAFTFHIKNTDPESIVINGMLHDRIEIKFTSIGSGFCPINYGFCIQFPIANHQSRISNNNNIIQNIQAEAWDNNVILMIEMSNVTFNEYKAGLNINNLMEYTFINCFNAQTPLWNGITTETNIIDKENNDQSKIQIKIDSVCDQEITIEINGNNIKEKPSSPTMESSTIYNSNDVEHEDDSENIKKNKTKKNKRKNKKVRSLSESNCDDLLTDITTSTTSTTTTKTSSSTNNDSMNNNINDGNKSYIKLRSISESSDDQIFNKPRGILKNRTSSFNRSVSDSSVDDSIYGCAQSLDYGISSTGGGIPEEKNTELEMSESCKKTVRFNMAIQKQLFRINSRIVGQRKPQANKRKKKKRVKERRYSEGEASDYEANKEKSMSSKIVDKSHNQNDSGVDFSDSNNNIKNTKSKKSNTTIIKNSINILNKKSSNDFDAKVLKNSADKNKNSLDLELKNGMIFDIEI